MYMDRNIVPNAECFGIALQSDALTITPSDPEAHFDIFGYILAFS